MIVFHSTPSCFPDVSYHVSSLLRFAPEITNPAWGICSVSDCVCSSPSSVRILTASAAHGLCRPPISPSRLICKDNAGNYKAPPHGIVISGVTGPVRRGFVLRPTGGGRAGKHRCVGNVCARCYHWAYNNSSGSGSPFLNRALIKTRATVTDWRADTCASERRQCGDGSRSAAPLNFTKQTAGLGGSPALMRDPVGLLRDAAVSGSAFSAA